MRSKRAYIGVSRTTFSTLTSSTVSFAKCTSAATCAAVIWASCFCIFSRTRRASGQSPYIIVALVFSHEFALPNDAALLVLNMLPRQIG